MPWLTPEESLKACYGKPEPKRPPYVADRPFLYPPVPDQCPRCDGLIVTQYGETSCIPCGWRHKPIPLPQEPTMRKSGASLPRVVEVGR